ncbi:MAG: hypothetical protein WC346_16490 [Methanogenium sp.]|jgi:uncharacterized protein YoxC
MLDKKEENLISTLKLISETLDNHKNRINSLLELAERQNKIIEKQNKIVNELILKVNTLELINLKDRIYG